MLPPPCLKTEENHGGKTFPAGSGRKRRRRKGRRADGERGAGEKGGQRRRRKEKGGMVRETAVEEERRKKSERRRSFRGPSLSCHYASATPDARHPVCRDAAFNMLIL